MLKLDLAELKTLGDNIGVKADEFKTILDNINRVNDNLSLYWQGADAEQYKTTVESQAKEMEKLYNVLKECSNCILSAKKAYEEALNANMGK